MHYRQVLIPLLLITLCAVTAAPAAAQGTNQQQTFAVNPGMLDFGDVVVGQSKTLTVQGSIVNQQFSVVFVNVDSDNLAFTSQPTSILAAQGEIIDFDITFTPTAAGPTMGTITFSTPVISSTEEGGPQQSIQILDTVAVTGVGVLASFTVAPSELNFPPTPVGTTSDPLNVRITAGPALMMAIDIDIRSPNSVFAPVTSLVTLMPGGRVDVPVTFTPDQAAPVISTLIVRGEDGSQQNVVLRGSGVPFTVDPDPLILPTSLTGCSSNAPITVTPGGPLDYLAGTVDRRFVVRPNQGIETMPFQMDVSIGSTPEGDTATDLIINAREMGSVAFQDRIPVMVTGIDLSTAAPSIDFGTVPVGSGPQTQTVRVAQSVSQMLMLTVQATSDSSDFVVESIQGDAITVRFEPQAAGSFSGTIVALVSPEVDPDCNRQIRIPVRGIAEETAITLDPTILDFGTTEIGGTSRRTVTLTNGTTIPYRGTVTVTPGVFNLQPGGESTASFSLAAGAVATFELGFSPVDSGFLNGSAEFLLQPSSGPTVSVNRTLPLRGEAVQTELTFEIISGGVSTPVAGGSTFDAPRTPVGSAAFLDFRILNQGTAPVTISDLSIAGTGFSATERPSLPAIVNPGGILPMVVQFSPTAPGAASATITVDDSQFLLNGVGVLTGGQVTGLGSTISPASQTGIGVSIEQAVDVPVNGTLTLNYQPRNGGDDSMAGFALGGRTAGFTIRPGSTDAQFADDATSMGLQSGTIAADFNITAQFDTGGVDVTPLTAVEANTALEASAPTIVSVSIEDRTATSFTVAVVGFSTTREVSQASFRFTARSGVQIPSSTVTAAVTDAFTAWFSTSQFGGLFTLRVPFTVSGADNAASSVAVTLQNSAGTSASASASIQ